MQELDDKILKELLNDSRQSYRDIANKLDISEGTVYNHVMKLKDSGILKKFTSEIDPKALGFDITAIIGIRTEGSHLLDVEKELTKMPNVVAVYDVTGDWDALIIAKFKNTDSLNKLIKDLISRKYITRTHTMLALNVLKENFTELV